MYLDFHIHIFVDAIAERAISRLAKTASLTPNTDGTAADTRKKLAEWGIDKAVVLPIATKPSQQRTINDWAAALQDDTLLCFGSVFPGAEDAIEELSRLKALGLRGIKLHPDYQNFFVDDPQFFPLYRACASLSLPIVFHAGFDPLSPDLIHGTPKAFATVAEEIPELTLILAHLGGERCWDDVERYLVGRKNVYLDTAFLSFDITPEQAERIIRTHGTDRVLFASDCPWDKPLAVRDLIANMHFTPDEQTAIFSGNAVRLLGL